MNLTNNADVYNFSAVNDDAEMVNAPSGAPQGYFNHLPYYMKLHETLNGAYEVGSRN